jgi:predicted dithiol-disulfide oxidoreductase (DUF899 family)
MDLPPAASREEWLAARKNLPVKEKAATRARDELNAERCRLPMVRIARDYVFDAPAGKRGLLDLFDGRCQLIIYHFMFDPAWDEGCPSCSLVVDNIGHLSHLHAATPRWRWSPVRRCEDRGLPRAHGLDGAVAVLVRQ